MGRVTVKTLAAAVGVSPSTVSNAYNRPDQLSAELRTRILAKADELGFAGPDAAGRALRVGRAGAVGVLLSERLSYAFSDPWAIEFLAGLSEALEDDEVSIVLMPQTSATAVRQANIDALAIVSLPYDHPVAAVARSRGLSLVTSDAHDDPEASWVAIDDFAGGALVGEHLAAYGHRDVAVLVDTFRPAGSPAVRLELADVEFVDYAARVAGLRSTVPGALTVVSGGHNAEPSGASAVEWLLAQDHLPTAIVGLSDVLALGALRALESHGLIAPVDVSVCGFDDIPAARAADLTTVRQPIRERGQAMGRLLRDPEAQPRQVRLPIALVPRASTGPARSEP